MNTLKIQYSFSVIFLACFIVSFAELPFSAFPSLHYYYTYHISLYINMLGWLSFFMSFGLILYNRRKIDTNTKRQIKWIASLGITTIAGLIFILNIVFLVIDW